MTERWKSWKAKGRLSTRSHRSLEISHTPRDFHIPTARADRGWKKWKTKTRFPTFSTRDPRLRMRFAGLQKNQNQNALDRRQAAVPERRYSEHRRLADGRKGAGGSRRFQDHYSIRKCCASSAGPSEFPRGRFPTRGTAAFRPANAIALATGPYLSPAAPLPAAL